MTITPPPKSQEICQKLLRGYQFSDSDLYSAENSELYNILDKHFTEFQSYLAMVGFRLIRDDGIIFLEKEDKELSNEERQTIVVLYLFVDLCLEKGKSYADLWQLNTSWMELDWFRDGYGKEYLLQVGIEDKTDIEDLLKKIQRKGLVDYQSETGMIKLRRPTERLYNLARKIYLQLKAKDETDHE